MKISNRVCFVILFHFNMIFFAFALGKQSEKHIFFVSFMHCVQFSIQHSNKVAVLAWPLFIFGGGF